MSLLAQDKFIAHLKDRAASEGVTGFPTRVLYDTGMKFGITNAEVYTHFLGKDRAISRGKYLPSTPVDLSTVPAKSKRKSTKAAKVPAQSKMLPKDCPEKVDPLAAAIAVVNKDSE